MTSTPPLTDQQLAAWAADLAEITESPWLVADDEYGQPVIYVEQTDSDGRTTARTLLEGAAATEADVQFMTRSPERIAALLAEVARLRADVRQLAVAAENGKHSLAAFAADTTDPGSAALGALYLLRNALAGQPDIEPAYLEVTPERLRAAHFREAARLLEDTDHDDDAVNLLDSVARGIAAQAPACSCAAEPVHQAGCAATPA